MDIGKGYHGSQTLSNLYLPLSLSLSLKQKREAKKKKTKLKSQMQNKESRRRAMTTTTVMMKMALMMCCAPRKHVPSASLSSTCCPFHDRPSLFLSRGRFCIGCIDRCRFLRC